jgi:tripartite-type tricarboxylate transporter receptor subunit TctC
VPFQSGAPALSALLGHHVDINVGPVAETHPMVLQGTVRALAVTGPRRADALPDVPTLEELGFSGIAINGFIALLAPAKTPVEIREKLNAAINQVIALPNVEQRLRALGYEPYRGTLADAPAYLRRQIDTWGDLIRATGIATE